MGMIIPNWIPNMWKNYQADLVSHPTSVYSWDLPTGATGQLAAARLAVPLDLVKGTGGDMVTTRYACYIYIYILCVCVCVCVRVHVCIHIHYITLHYITLHYITLHYITLHYITLHYITLHYITLHYITLHYITLHYITLHTYIYIYMCVIMCIYKYISCIGINYMILIHYLSLCDYVCTSSNGNGTKLKARRSPCVTGTLGSFTWAQRTNVQQAKISFEVFWALAIMDTVANLHLKIS